MSSTPNNQPFTRRLQAAKSRPSLDHPKEQDPPEPSEPMEVEPSDAKAEDVELRYYTSLVGYQLAKKGRDEKAVKPPIPVIELAGSTNRHHG